MVSNSLKNFTPQTSIPPIKITLKPNYTPFKSHSKESSSELVLCCKEANWWTAWKWHHRKNIRISYHLPFLSPEKNQQSPISWSITGFWIPMPWDHHGHFISRTWQEINTGQVLVFHLKINDLEKAHPGWLLVAKWHFLSLLDVKEDSPILISQTKILVPKVLQQQFADVVHAKTHSRLEKSVYFKQISLLDQHGETHCYQSS